MGTGVARAQHPRPQPRRRLRTFGGLLRLGGPYLAFLALRHIVSLERLARFAWRDPGNHPRDPQLEARTIAQATKLRHLLDRTDRRCLPRSLALYRALSRAGASPQLWIGFRKVAGRVDGHAWVAVDGRPVGEAEALMPSLTPTCGFGVKGATIALESGTGMATSGRGR